MKQVKILILFLFSLIVFSSSVFANTYLTENSTWQENLTAVNRATLTLGDIDGDGYLDLSLTGFLGGYHNKIYINNGTSLVENDTWEQNLTGVRYGSSAFGDIDNDGDLDLALTGCSSGGGLAQICDSGSTETFIYINNGTSLAENTSWVGDIEKSWKGSIAFGDVDNDGKLDLAVTGQGDTSGKISKIYINNGTSFAENTTWQQDLTALTESSLAWGDLDNDNDLDLIISGDSGSSVYISKVYINNGTNLAENSTWQTNLLDIEHTSITLGDFDNNGRIDLSIIGKDSNDRHEIYNNTGTTFNVLQDDGTGNGDLLGIYEGSQSFGDYDNDGYLDLITTGKEGHTTLYLYNSTSSNFSHKINDPETDILNLQSASYIVWGDLDNDSDLDLIETGYIEEGINANRIKIYINNISTKNNAPAPPTDFNTTYSNNQLTIQWNNASDPETATLGLYYNIKVGNKSNNHSIVTGVYGGGDDNGYFGNMMQRKSITLSVPSLGANETIYWSVQTIDTTLKAGNWSTVQNYSLPVDVTRPEIILNAPEDQNNTTSTTIDFNVTVSDNTNITNVSLYGNWSTGWHANETNGTTSNATGYIFSKDLSAYGDGVYLWLIEAYDAENNSRNSSIRTFTIDTTPPIINLTTPINNSTWTSSNIVNFAYNVSELTLINCSLVINGIRNQTNHTIASDTSLDFNITLINGDYNWSINCTDVMGYENSSEIRNLTVRYTAPVTPSDGGGGSGNGGSSSTSTVCSTGAIKCISKTQYQECDSINTWSETKDVLAGKMCEFGMLKDVEEEKKETTKENKTIVEVVKEISEPVTMEDNTKKYFFLLFGVILIGFGYLIWYEIHHWGDKKKR